MSSRPSFARPIALELSDTNEGDLRRETAHLLRLRIIAFILH